MIPSYTRTLGSPLGIASRPGRLTPSDRVGSLLRRTGLAIWHALEDVGQARANRELRLLADRCVITDPVLAAQLRRASTFDATSRTPTSTKP